jgi:hypothetical protein
MKEHCWLLSFTLNLTRILQRIFQDVAFVKQQKLFEACAYIFVNISWPKYYHNIEFDILICAKKHLL